MSNRLLIGTQKGLFRIARDDKGRWAMHDSRFIGDPVSLVLSEPGSRRLHAAFALGHFGVKMQRSEDGGASWQEAPVPGYPEKPADIEDKDPMRGIDIPWSTQLIWSMALGGTPNELWCGTIPGGLFRSVDGGDNWTLIRALWDDPRRRQWMGGGYDFAGIHSILVDPRDPAHITVAISVGGVWTTHDAGTNWTLIGNGLRNDYTPPGMGENPLMQDPHRVVQCPTAPDRLWMQHHNGIFVSDNGGIDWRELTDVPPSAFGFAVVVHPDEPDTAWFVPAAKDEQRVPVDARLVVTRTRDGGRSFDVLGNGLPDEPAYDLIYRHAFDISADGERLAFGSTTGGLWVSENRGDDWQCVSTHLPPINSVCFEMD